MPLLVNGDAVRLEQVIQNLLNNAVKYSPSGGTITLEAAPDAGSVVMVGDEGIGIPASELPRVFEQLYRAGNAAQHRSSRRIASEPTVGHTSPRADVGEAGLGQSAGRV